MNLRITRTSETNVFLKKMKTAVLFLSVAVVLLPGLVGCAGNEPASNEVPEQAAVDVQPAEQGSTSQDETASDEPEAPADQQAQSSAEGLDIYSLISLEEVSALMGEPMLEPEYSENPVVGQKILFFATEAETLPVRYFQLSVNESTDTINAANLYDDTRDVLLGEDVQPVEGIGDDAVWGTMGLHILKGDCYIVLSVGNSDLPENLELAKQFAGIILPRMP